MIAREVITGGFADPVFDSQVIFRRVLDAFACPGTVVAMPGVVSPPAPLHASVGALVSALADEDTPIHLDRRAAQGSASAWIRFHTGAPLTDSPEEGHFAVLTEPREAPSFEAFSQGSQEYPDRSATIVLQLEDFSGGRTLKLEGPGIERSIEISPYPLPEDFVERMRRNRARFPRGFDLVLASPDAVVALPRSLRVSLSRSI